MCSSFTEILGKQESREVGGRKGVEDRKQGVEMAQAIYGHMNKF
jgi:hypothetical protein